MLLEDLYFFERRDTIVDKEEELRMKRDNRYDQIREDQNEIACLIQDNCMDLAPMIHKLMQWYGSGNEVKAAGSTLVEMVELMDRLCMEQANREVM